MHAIGILLVSLIGVTIFGTIFYSIRYRRSQGVAKGIYQAYMNMNMGAMFISIATLQLLIPSSSWLRHLLIFLIFALGLINLYYGVKNYRYFKRVSNRED